MFVFVYTFLSDYDDGDDDDDDDDDDDTTVHFHHNLLFLTVPSVVFTLVLSSPAGTNVSPTILTPTKIGPVMQLPQTANHVFLALNHPH